MLRIYFLQQWYSLSDAGTEDFIYDIHIARIFAQVELDQIPDDITILNFRRIIEKNQLSDKFLKSPMII